MNRPLVIIDAPSNLGLRPLRPGHVPGTWRAPEALRAAGLEAALRPSRVVALAHPAYEPGPEAGTRMRNGHRIRAFNLELADRVAETIDGGGFPVVVGGDCSILVGALAGARRHSALSLVHVDGHSDFRHPGNYDPSAMPGAVGGMDLALATGRGEALLTEWPDVPVPLVPDAQVVQIGEREARDRDYAFPDIRETAITRIEVFEAQEAGGILAATRRVLDRTGWPFWVHFDVDVLDAALMPAVDSPGSPGIETEILRALLAGLVQDVRCAGLTVTIFDPDLDPEGTHAAFLVALLRDVLGW